MALEPITRQEQIIAGKDLEPITRMEKFLKEYGGGGGASSWNDLDDRPFGEVTTYGDTLTWDGNIEGLNEGHADTAIFPIYRVSEATPSVEELSQGGTLQLFMGGEIMEAPFTTTLPDGEGIVLSDDGSSQMPFVYIFSDGIYLAYDNSEGELVYVSSLTINGYNGFEMKSIKQLDNKYLKPFETVGGDTLTWDGNTEGLVVNEVILGSPAYLVSEIVPAVADFANGAMIWCSDDPAQGLTAELNDVTEMMGVEGFILVPSSGVPAVLGVSQDVTVEGVGALKKGLYLLNDGSVYVTSLKVNGYTGFTTTKLKEEYIPVDYIKQLIAEVTGK